MIRFRCIFFIFSLELLLKLDSYISTIFAHNLLFDARIEILKITELKSLFVIFKNVQLWRPLVAEQVRNHGSRWATENKGLEATTVSSGLFRSFTA